MAPYFISFFAVIDMKAKAMGWSRASLGTFLIFAFVILIAPTAPWGRDSLRIVVDEATGAQVSLPEEFLTSRKPSKFGSNWVSTDRNVNVDTLRFPAQQTLKAVFDKLHQVRGRTFSRNDWRGVKFTLEGKDKDGSTFLIEVQQGTAGLDDLRGLSVVCERPQRGCDELRARIAQSFQPFPSAAGAASLSETAMLQPQEHEPAGPVSPYAIGGVVLNGAVAQTQAYSCKLSAAMEDVRWCQKLGSGSNDGLPDTVMQGANGSAIYLVSQQNRGVSSKEEAERNINERSRLLGEQPTKIYWRSEDRPDSVIAVWGQLRLEDLIYPDWNIDDGNTNVQLVNIEGSKGSLDATRGEGSLYRIIGGKGLLYSASIGGAGSGFSRLIAIDAGKVSTSQFHSKMSAVLRKDQSLAANDFSLWVGVAGAARRLARDTSPSEANAALDAVFAKASSQKFRSHAWAILPGGVQEGLGAGEYRTIDIYPPKTTYVDIRKDIERYLASEPKDRFREFSYYVIGDFDGALKTDPASVIAPVLHYAAGHRIIASLAFEASDALKKRVPNLEEYDFVPREERDDPVAEPVNRSIRLINRFEDVFHGDLSTLVPNFVSRAEVARPHFEAVLQSKTSPLADDAAYMLSWIDFYSGKYEDAVAQFERAMSRGNTDYKRPAAMKQMVRMMQEQYEPEKQSALVGTNLTFAQQPALWYVAARSGYRLFKYQFVIDVTKQALDSLKIPLDRLPGTTDANLIDEDLTRIDASWAEEKNAPEIIYLYQASTELLDYSQLVARLSTVDPAQFSKRARQIIVKYSLLLDAPERKEGQPASASAESHKDLRQALHLIDVTLEALPHTPAYETLREWLHYRKTRIAMIFVPETVEGVVAAMEADVPQSKLMDDALAELLYFEGTKRNLKAAEATFKKIQEKYPDGNAVDNAYTWMAKIYRCVGRPVEAEKLNREIIRKFPFSRHALLAEGRLASKETDACGLPEEAELVAWRYRR
jgi:tetratricopeptide (TPR) repeat protein